ncbi:hypothetical protein SAMN03159507_00589 [Pseudomonas sp. NFACC32-1]|nr:hypothetical protein SAMN03159507_00589 [Pseudomonas sp. NFACC32-1]SFW65819.1 hypothetical protein SAMN03159376_02731 [Pseudomonas sp. NFACC09-4]SFX30000.1 hypothetical protein SAMN03159390_00970 [Pseudomonas sp. NFACC49-2]
MGAAQYANLWNLRGTHQERIDVFTYFDPQPLCRRVLLNQQGETVTDLLIHRCSWIPFVNFRGKNIGVHRMLSGKNRHTRDSGICRLFGYRCDDSNQLSIRIKRWQP